jgi:hypothetical protein
MTLTLPNGRAHFAWNQCQGEMHESSTELGRHTVSHSRVQNGEQGGHAIDLVKSAARVGLAGRDDYDAGKISAATSCLSLSMNHCKHMHPLFSQGGQGGLVLARTTSAGRRSTRSLSFFNYFSRNEST